VRQALSARLVPPYFTLVGVTHQRLAGASWGLRSMRHRNGARGLRGQCFFVDDN
jgi:hypothetical protein